MPDLPADWPDLLARARAALARHWDTWPGGMDDGRPAYALAVADRVAQGLADYAEYDRAQRGVFTAYRMAYTAGAPLFVWWAAFAAWTLVTLSTRTYLELRLRALRANLADLEAPDDA